jgi:hypothetical protein
LLAEDRIAELDQKLDFIVEELVSLKRLTESAEDLAAHLSLVGKSAMRDAVEAFGAADLCPGEIVGLFKAVLENAGQPILRDGMLRMIQGGPGVA